MENPYRLLCVLAHPDDESLGTGGILARYAAEGVETYLVTATRGEHGWAGEAKDYPGPQALGRIREAELHAAARVLGLREVSFLDYLDGELDRADPIQASARIAGHIRRIRPHVIITFGPDGAYGHPDHIAISQLTAAAIALAAGGAGAEQPHQVAKFYYMADTRAMLSIYQSAFGELTMDVDGIRRGVTGWEDWAVTTRIRSVDYWQTVWQAVRCHQSQLSGYDRLQRLSPAEHIALWGERTYYRAFSLVNGGRALEEDLFAGLR